MPTVLRWGPYRVYFYSNERGEPAHVHVRADNREAKVWLHDLTISIKAGYAAHELGVIIGHLRLHRKSLLDAWNEHFRN